MKLRHPLLIRIIAALAALLIRVWINTVRTRVVSADGLNHPLDPADRRLIYAFWHESLLAPLSKRPKARVLISQHRDGELIAQIIQWLGLQVIRGSTSRGGSQALLEMIRGGDEQTHLAITPDGPQGPRRQLQAGVVMVASQTGLAVVPLGVGFVSAWRASSWDRFAIPRPYSTLVGVMGHPIRVPKDLDRAGLAHWKRVIEAQMLATTAVAEDWAARLQNDRHAPAPNLAAISPPSLLRQTA